MKHQVETLFLFYVNEFLTIERFAEYHLMDIDYAHRIIRIGRKLNDRWTKR